MIYKYVVDSGESHGSERGDQEIAVGQSDHQSHEDRDEKRYSGGDPRPIAGREQFQTLAKSLGSRAVGRFDVREEGVRAPVVRGRAEAARSRRRTLTVGSPDAVGAEFRGGWWFAVRRDRAVARGQGLGG